MAGTELRATLHITYRAGEPSHGNAAREMAAGWLSGVWDPSVKDARTWAAVFQQWTTFNQDLVARGVHPAGWIRPDRTELPTPGTLTVCKTICARRKAGAIH